MLSQKQIGTLSRSNAIIETEKAAARIIEDYKSASAENKKAMCELAQLSDNAYYVVGKRKTASAKHIAAMAQTLGVNPYYYTGESDDKKPFTGEIMEGFMKKHTDKKPTAVKAKTANKKPAAKKAAKPTASKTKTTKPAPKAEVKKPTAKAVKAKPVKPEPKVKPVSKKTVPAKAVKPAPVKKPRTPKVAAPTPSAKNDSVLATIQLDNSAKMNKAVKNLSVDDAVLILQALSRKAEAGGNAEVLYDLIKRCLLT
jgi:hypothetical protein